jgi:aldehyde dehydrogenase (NAD+)
MTTAYDGFERMPIAGEWREGSGEETRADTDPWSGETLTELRQADSSDLDRAFEAAAEAQREWAEQPPSKRAGVLLAAAAAMKERKDEIVGWIVRESGGTLAKGELEHGLVLGVMNEAASLPGHVAGQIMPAEIPGKENRVYRKPAGVVSVISPWNFPMQLSNRSVAPALAVGNAVVLKPASDTPITGGLLLAKIYEEAGLPPGLLNVVVGSGGEIGDAIVEHPGAAVVSFTGSTPVGNGIAEKAPLKKLALELGGNGPLLVLADADLERAVDAAVFGSLFHQGQICMIANRVIVEEPVHDEFVERLVERVRGLRCGDPSDPETDLGPIINSSQVESIQDKIGRALNDGAEQLLGGEAGGPTGQLLPPHVLLSDNSSAVAREEVFGPVVTVIRAADPKAAVEIANDTEYGLSSAIFTADVECGLELAKRIEAGMTHINDSPVNDEPNTAFGGVKASGIGRFGGQWAVDEFTTDHWISVQHQPREFPI